MSTPNKLNKTTQGLRLVSYCPVCDLRSKSMMARTLGTQGETKLMHVQCHKCHNAFLALVLVNQVGASSVGLMTDLGYEDVIRFRSSKDVAVDDVIALHELFEQGLFRVPTQKKRVTQIKKNTRLKGKQIKKK